MTVPEHRNPNGDRLPRVAAELGDGAVTRDAQESFVAALQESDTAVETMQDAETDRRRRGASRTQLAIGVTGMLLAAAGLIVARRRK